MYSKMLHYFEFSFCSPIINKLGSCVETNTMFQLADKTLVLLFGILKKNFKVIMKFLLVQLIFTGLWH